jgi:UDP-N-acetylglucosamine:LPS N-acetylglucosamine transferase
MAPVKYKFAFLLSGPEPQRTLLEKKILDSLPGLQENVLLVRGKPGDTSILNVPANVTVASHLEGAELEKALNASEFLVSRAGYTTIMEIAAMKKKSILIPTPGQTEQEYLGNYLQERNWVMTASQEQFNLPQVLTTALDFKFEPFPIPEISLDEVVDAFLEQYFKPIPASSFAAS